MTQSSLDLVTAISEILVPESEYNHPYCRIEKIDKGYQITYGQMYEKPTVSFANLMSLSELFGTKEIDLDDYANGGCESCDYGSDYGHEIQIYNPTKNVEELRALVNVKIFGEK